MIQALLHSFFILYQEKTVSLHSRNKKDRLFNILNQLGRMCYDDWILEETEELIE